MRKFTRITALCMAMMTAMAACGNPGNQGGEDSTGKEAAAEESGKEEPEEIVEINVMVYDRGHEYRNGNTLTDNELTRWVNERMEPQGVHVNYVPVPRSEADDKINLMLTGGTAPDVIRTYDRQRVATYATQGGLLDLTPYMERLGEDYLSRAGDVLEYGQFDGGQYALPALQAYYGKSHETFLRQDLVEGVGMEMPKTREDLVDVLYAIKEKYPDIIPYGFGGKNTDGNYTNWLLSYTSRANERDNYIYEPTFTIVLKPGHKDGLRQLNQFVLDGIIDADFVMDTDNSKYDENIANGNYAFVMDGSGNCIDLAYETSGIEGYHMTEVDCLKNVDGTYEVPSQDAFSHYVYVPATAEKKIDAVMTYLNFLTQEKNAIELKYGIEGLGYDMVEGIPVERTQDERLKAGTSSNPSDNNFLLTNFEFEEEQLLDTYKMAYPQVPEDVAEARISSRYSNYFDRVRIPAALKTDEYAPLLQELIVEFVFKCMSAPEGKFDEVYEAEYQILLDNHLQEVLDERAAWYDANMK